MAVEKLSSYDTWSYDAGADLSTKQYYAMIFTAGKLAVAGANAEVIGILQDKPNAVDVAGTVAIRGASKAVAGAAITIGDYVATDASGKLIAATVGQAVVGIALSAAGADLEVFSVLIDRTQALA